MNAQFGGATKTDPAKIEAYIAKKTNGALTYALLSILGFTALVTCPLAFYYATQALQTIEQQRVGERFRNNANTARVLAVVIFVFYLVLALAILIPALTQGR
jgi:uncharacterized membrane protein YidH (DUF202 family)